MTVKTKVTILANVNTNVNVNVTASGTMRTVTERPRTRDGVDGSLLLKYTLTRTATVCNFIVNLLVIVVLNWLVSGRWLEGTNKANSQSWRRPNLCGCWPSYSLSFGRGILV